MSMIEYAGRCEQGPVRPNNEDFIAQQVPSDDELRLRRGMLFVIADGVGGSRAGEVASRVATEQLIEHYYGSRRQPRRALADAFKQSNLQVYDLGLSNPEYRRMETTLTALALMGDQAVIAHVGDSRIYRVHATNVEQLTNDHSEVGELVRMQLISVEEARHHPRRNIITRSIGNDLLLKVDVRSVPVAPDDIFVLCSDGLWEPVGMEEIAECVTLLPPDAACQRLVDLAIERDTCDNVSVQVIKVLGWEQSVTSLNGGRTNIFQRAFRFLGNGEQPTT